MDWRALLDEHRIPWRDRGANTSRGNINIRCPFCNDDPSFHLTIAEDYPAYYCFRNPRKHSGQNLGYLLRALNISPSRIPTTMTPTPQPQRARTDHLERWRKFPSASESRYCLDYLEKRGFDDPEGVCRTFDLRYAPNGTWAQRLLFPLTDGFSGRALRDDLSPKYLSEADTSLYVPIAAGPIMVVFEGPFDALKAAAAVGPQAYTLVALCGMKISDAKAVALSNYNVHTVLLSLDANVSPAVNYYLLNELSIITRARRTVRLKLPPGYDDAAELPLGCLREWLRLDYPTGVTTTCEKTRAITNA